MALGLVITREASGGDAWVWAKPAPDVVSPPAQVTQIQTRQPVLNAA